MRHDSMTNLRIRNPSGATVSLGSRFAGLSTVFILLFLTGCASVGTPRLSANKESAEQQLRGDMVADLLSVLPQILEPLNTTIQVSDTESGDADNAMSRLVELGYGLQRVNADQGNHFLYLVELPAVTAESRSDTRLRLAVGDLEFTRSYRIMRKDKNLDRANLIWRGGQAVVPTGPMKVAGTRQTLVLDGIDIEIASNTEGSKGEQGLVTGSVEFAALAPIDGGIPSISLITDDIVQQVAKTASAGPSLASLNAHNDNFGNLFNGGASAYASVLDNYDRVAREFVIFRTILNSLASRQISGEEADQSVLGEYGYCRDHWLQQWSNLACYRQ